SSPPTRLPCDLLFEVAEIECKKESRPLKAAVLRVEGEGASVELQRARLVAMQKAKRRKFFDQDESVALRERFQTTRHSIELRPVFRETLPTCDCRLRDAEWNSI